VKKLKLMSPMSAEATVVRNYIETLLNLPWKKKSRISKDLSAAEKVLDKDHYGLEKVKERIVEYLAVQQRVDKVKAPILCLVGPPGVGKTSLGQSIAAPPTASSCAWRWAACATRPRSAATAAPTSARCRARSCRT
jgi:ATP-dependent Lon protease